MINLLLIMSKDPYTTETPDLVLDIGLSAKEKGNDVSLYLVEDRVTAARKAEFGNKLEAAQKKGMKIYEIAGNHLGIAGKAQDTPGPRIQSIIS